MGRTIIKIPFVDFKRAEDSIHRVLYGNKFKQTMVNSEIIWKKGGTVLGGQCLKIEYSEKEVVVSAWITPFLGGEEEFDLESVGALIPKQQLLSVIEQIKISIR